MAVKLKSSAFVKDLVKRTKLIHHYETAWTDWDGPFSFTYESKEQDDAFHPSGDCTPTSYALYHKALAKMAGKDHDPISPTLRKTFLVGHFWHQVYQDLTVKELGFADPRHVERQMTSSWGKTIGYINLYPGVTNLDGIDQTLSPIGQPYHWARGAADIAPCEIPRQGKFLIDFKTMNSRDFGRISPPNWAVDKWECQVNIYMNWFKLERALIVGINKDSPHDLKEFEFHYNEPLVNAIYEKWHNVSDCITRGIEPTEDEDPPLPLMGVIET